MKTEQEINERIDELELDLELQFVKGSTEFVKTRGRIDALQWVLRDD